MARQLLITLIAAMCATASNAKDLETGVEAMVVLSLGVRVPDDRREGVIRTLRSLIGPASAEAACVSCRAFHDSSDQNSITFVQAWTSREDLERHVSARQFKVLLAVADLSEREPEIRIDGLSPIGGGIEVLARIGAAKSQ